MSTVPATPLLDTPIDGPIVDVGPLEIPVQVLVEEVVAARRALEELRGKRTEAVKLLADADGRLGRASQRVLNAENAWHGYIAARVAGPIS